MLGNTSEFGQNLIQNKLEKFQANILKDVDKKIGAMIDDVMQEMRLHELRANEFKEFANNTMEAKTSTWNNRVAKYVAKIDAIYKESTTNDNWHSERHNDRRTCLPDKVFVTRESYLTALLEVDHMKAIYHIFYIILMVLLMNSVCYDYFVEGRINFGLGTFKSGLAGIDFVFGIWISMHFAVLGVYYAFKMWMNVRQSLLKNEELCRFWSYSCVIVFLGFQLLLGYIGSVSCIKLDLPFVSASVLLLETCRMLMKTHAFVRTNAAKVLAGKIKDDDDTDPLNKPVRIAPFGTYLFFLFAPTLVYRESYPRTKQIRWTFALCRFLEVVAIAFLYSYIHERHIRAHFQNYGKDTLTKAGLIVKLFGMMMPGVIIFLCGFYLILHSWLNFTAELLLFGDRMFYKDWWTSPNFEVYYRHWNVVVHDWLYEYVYKDIYNYIFKGSKVTASVVVFFVSAFVHEHILAFALQLFYPIMFLFFFVIGVVMIYATKKCSKRLGNLIVWGSIIIGNGLMVSLYSMEYYARLNCPPKNDKLTDFIIPVSWTCNGGVLDL